MDKPIKDKATFRRVITLEVDADHRIYLDKETMRAKEILHLGGIENGRLGNITIKTEDGVVDRYGNFIPNWKLGWKRINHKGEPIE